MGQSRPLFCSFSYFPHDTNQFKLIQSIDSKFGTQTLDSQIHWPMAAPQLCHKSCTALAAKLAECFLPTQADPDLNR